MNHLDGDQVDFIIRNRYAPQGDFFREENQHLIVKSLLEKFLSLNLIDKTRLITRFSPELVKLQQTLVLAMSIL